ncbi:helix-turn-helix transcriptional regulator [Luteolibacter yonseiensis]|uniref:Helix-turn-helix transcriptional regulator n=1 Tax=Luteolibacter yonseiensis TaxID=1144680 RepID=A0A934R3G1_9BACT|nr:helix-turn-helix transcriptional regulator [Luteolibacter yonseiensis]MBK1816194.1 helix-turn-helix transcriptional regulator [Luteolibacter yonseiensis]
MLTSLRDIRIARRVSLRELSKKVGVHSTHLSRMEKCETHPNVVLAFRWSDALNVDFGQLYHASLASENGDATIG